MLQFKCLFLFEPYRERNRIPTGSLQGKNEEKSSSKPLFFHSFKLNIPFACKLFYHVRKNYGELEGEQPKMLVKENKCKGYSDSFDTVQKLATYSDDARMV